VPDRALVSDDFDVPRELITEQFRLEPLGPQHNDRDHQAWTSSIGHIRATPGFSGGSWPPPDGMSLEDNLTDLKWHADQFVERASFSYTVLEIPGDDVIGCVYIYPPHDDNYDVHVRSWVRADRAALDPTVYESVTAWLASSWPFHAIDYAPRP
jgi:hypothetical protein